MKTNASRQGGILVPLLVTGLVLVAVACAVGLYVVRNVAQNVRVTHSQDGRADVSIDTPAGHLLVRAHETVDPESLGIPSYPGAVRRKDSHGGAEVEWRAADGKPDKDIAVAASESITQDPPAKVLEFYRSKLPSWRLEHDLDGETRLELSEGGAKRIIGIIRKSDGTHIGVATVGEPASN